MKVPRWGIHKGIKYYPKRSILKLCPVCNQLFLHNSKGNKKYCSELCSINAEIGLKKARNKEMINNRDNFEHANKMRDLYMEGKLSKRKWTVGTDIIPKPKVLENGSIDWDSYHVKLQSKLTKLSLT